MERKSYALVTVVFTAVFTACILCALFFLGINRHSPVPYRMHTAIPVHGLHEGSRVKFRGIDVGRVTSVAFSKTDSGFIDIVMDINEGTPVTKGTVGSVNVHPVTGLASVELLDEGVDPTLLPSSEENPTEIPVVMGTVGKVTTRGMEIIQEVHAVTSSLAPMFSNSQHKAVHDLLVDLSQKSAGWVRGADAIGRVALDVPNTVHQGDVFFKKMVSLAADVKKVQKVVKQKMTEHLSTDELNELESILAKTDRILHGINAMTSDFKRGNHPLLVKTKQVKGPGER